jgi:hypothetical protein
MKYYLVGTWVRFYANSLKDQDLTHIGEIISITLNKEGKAINYRIKNAVMMFDIHPEMVIEEYNK